MSLLSGIFVGLRESVSLRRPMLHRARRRSGVCRAAADFGRRTLALVSFAPIAMDTDGAAFAVVVSSSGKQAEVTSMYAFRLIVAGVVGVWMVASALVNAFPY